LLPKDPKNVIQPPVEVFVCLKCSRPLFLKDDIVHHKEKTCKDIFIVPYQWMTNDLLNLSGNISCPDCKKSIGRYSWKSSNNYHCSCQKSISPSFIIFSSRVIKKVLQ